MTTPPRAELLDAATTELAAVGMTSTVDPAVAGYCLHAAELLCDAGGRVADLAVWPAEFDIETVIRNALARLSRQPETIFALPAVLDAAASARAALACLARSDADLAG